MSVDRSLSPALEHPALCRLLQQAYSAERAACFAYIGHAGSLRDAEEIARIQEIEQDEWDHRKHVHEIMGEYGVPISRWLEMKFFLIGKVIGFSCYLIGRFMPYFFAGKLESGNVCEYFVMIRYFHELGITKHDPTLFEMGVKEKEHEVYFQTVIEDEKWLPWFERIFRWGADTSQNDVELENLKEVFESEGYCPGRGRSSA